MKNILKIVMALTLVVFLVSACTKNKDVENTGDENGEKIVDTKDDVKDDIKDGEEPSVEGDSENDKESKEMSDKGEDNGLYDKIIEKGKFVMGTSADYPPFEYHREVDGKDEILGFDVEFAKEIAKDLGVELVIEDMSFDGLIPALEAGKIDVAIAGMSEDPERAKSVDFSDVYIELFNTVIVREEDKESLNSIEAINGKKVGAQKGTVQVEAAKNHFPDSTVTELATIPQLIMDLSGKKTDAVVVVVPVAKQYTDANSGIFMTSLDLGSEGGMSVAMPKNSHKLVEEINKTITRLEADGQIDKLYAEADEIAKED